MTFTEAANKPDATHVLSDEATVERRNELYGLSTRLKGERMKGELTRSHVLQPGEYNLTESNHQNHGKWVSSSALDYLGKRPAQMTLPNPSMKQLETHFKIGNESGQLIENATYRASVTMDDFDKKVTDRPEVMAQDPTINWPDMAPRYLVDRKMGHSEYGSAFHQNTMLNPRAPTFPRIDTSRLNLQKLKVFKKTEALKGTHVSLGTDAKNYFESETERAYCHSAPASGSRTLDPSATARAHKVASFMKQMERQSHVFRDGDYNGITQSCLTTAMTDFGKKTQPQVTSSFVTLPFINRKTDQGNPTQPGISTEEEGEEEKYNQAKSYENGESYPSQYELDNDKIDHLKTKVPGLIGYCMANNPVFKDADDGKVYQTSAHFKFGNDDDKLGSIYDKDFDVTRSAALIRNVVGVPKDSEVLANNPDCGFGISSNNSDFVQNTIGLSQIVNPDRSSAMQRNMSRRHGNNVVLAYDTSRHLNDRQKSISHSNYTSPPEDFKSMKALTTPISLYNYLETDGVHGHPVNKNKPTEVQYNFTSAFMSPQYSLQRLKWKEDQTKSRLNDGRSTHFILGNTNENLTSEAKHQYAKNPRVDSHMAPAGKMEIIPEFKFNHLNMSENMQDAGPVEENEETMDPSLPTKPVHENTVMMSDYRPMTDRRFTRPQLVMMKQDKKLSNKRWDTSHLFHTDTSGRNNLESTTMADYIQPETMTGQKFLAAR